MPVRSALARLLCTQRLCKVAITAVPRRERPLITQAVTFSPLRPLLSPSLFGNSMQPFFQRRKAPGHLYFNSCPGSPTRRPLCVIDVSACEFSILEGKEEAFEGRLKVFRQQRELSKVLPPEDWGRSSSPPHPRVGPIYSACGRIQIRVSGRCRCLPAVLRTLVIFCMSTAACWDVWRPVWPTTRTAYWDGPSPPSPPLTFTVLAEGCEHSRGHRSRHPTVSDEAPSV